MSDTIADVERCIKSIVPLIVQQGIDAKVFDLNDYHAFLGWAKKWNALRELAKVGKLYRDYEVKTVLNPRSGQEVDHHMITNDTFIRLVSRAKNNQNGTILLRMIQAHIKVPEVSEAPAEPMVEEEEGSDSENDFTEETPEELQQQREFLAAQYHRPDMMSPEAQTSRSTNATQPQKRRHEEYEDDEEHIKRTKEKEIVDIKTGEQLIGLRKTDQLAHLHVVWDNLRHRPDYQKGCSEEVLVVAMYIDVLKSLPPPSKASHSEAITRIYAHGTIDQTILQMPCVTPQQPYKRPGFFPWVYDCLFAR